MNQEDTLPIVPTEKQLRAGIEAVLAMCTPDEKTRLLEGLLELSEIPEGSGYPT